MFLFTSVVRVLGFLFVWRSESLMISYAPLVTLILLDCDIHRILPFSLCLTRWLNYFIIILYISLQIYFQISDVDKHRSYPRTLYFERGGLIMLLRLTGCIRLRLSPKFYYSRLAIYYSLQYIYTYISCYSLSVCVRSIASPSGQRRCDKQDYWCVPDLYSQLLSLSSPLLLQQCL